MNEKEATKESEWYGVIGMIFGGLSAVVAFTGSWWYCCTEYGYLFGFGLGWLPSIILAAIVYFAVRWLWGPAIALILYSIYY